MCEVCEALRNAVRRSRDRDLRQAAKIMIEVADRIAFLGVWLVVSLLELTIQRFLFLEIFMIMRSMSSMGQRQ